MKRILILTHSFNCLTQAVYLELKQAGYHVAIEFDISHQITQEAIDLFGPQVILCPYLKRKIPSQIWRQTPCFIIHPGVLGDRGPSSIDWAITRQQPQGGVTIFAANDILDGGEIWGSTNFPLRKTAKSSLYRKEVTAAAVKITIQVLADFFQRNSPDPHHIKAPQQLGKWHPIMQQNDRSFNWQTDSTVTILNKLRAADSFPGVLGDYFGTQFYQFNGEEEAKLRGPAGEIIATRLGAICRATIDGAIWITHLKQKATPQQSFLKLPATLALSPHHLLDSHLESPLPFYAVDYPTYQPINYRMQDNFGFLYFDFQGGAMSTLDCKHLQAAIVKAKEQPPGILILMGGTDFWSNGIHLGIIEQSASPATASLENVNALNALTREIIESTQHLIVAVMRGNAGAGGVFLALAADFILADNGVIINAHYKSMGNLFGSEYWTYLLPKRVGNETAQRIVDLKLPISVKQAVEMDLIDKAVSIPASLLATQTYLQKTVQELLAPSLSAFIKKKQATRKKDEASKPLSRYNEEEITAISQNFFGFDSSYHIAREHFIFKRAHYRTPSHLAHHREK